MGRAPVEGHAAWTAETPPRVALAPGLEASRIVVGLWQVADMERGGRILDPEPASSAMLGYARLASTASTWPTTTAAPR